jgi:hypothetical protein
LHGSNRERAMTDMGHELPRQWLAGAAALGHQLPRRRSHQRGSYDPDNGLEGGSSARQRRAINGLMHRSKRRPYSITSSAIC